LVRRSNETPFQEALFDRNICLATQGGKPMGLTHSLNVLMISAAFLFVATMIFI